MKRLNLKRVFVFVCFTLLLSSCSTNNLSPDPFGSDTQTRTYQSVSEWIDGHYPLIDMVKSVENPDNVSNVYLAENQSIPQVSEQITTAFTPNQTSEFVNNKQVFIYDKLFVILTEEQSNSSNTLIEVSDHRFVRNNYTPDFFDGLFLMWVLDDVLDVDDWHKKQKARCNERNNNNCYGGYLSSGGMYKGPGKTPTIRQPESSVRGGGPGSGK